MDSEEKGSAQKHVTRPATATGPVTGTVAKSCPVTNILSVEAAVRVNLT